MKHMTAKDLRKQTPKHSDRQPCFACGGHQSITHLHHVISLRECADMLNNEYTNEISIPTVWLCPNCHAYIHRMLDRGAYMETVQENDRATCEKVAEILKMHDDAIITILQPLLDKTREHND